MSGPSIIYTHDSVRTGWMVTYPLGAGHVQPVLAERGLCEEGHCREVSSAVLKSP